MLSWTYGAASGAQYINSALGMLDQVMSVSYEQYVMDDLALGIVKEKFKEHQSAKASQIAVEAAVEALNFFGVPADAKIEEELAARIRHIETPLEPYSENISRNSWPLSKSGKPGR